jgi:hypothetical protein
MPGKILVSLLLPLCSVVQGQYVQTNLSSDGKLIVFQIGSPAISVAFCRKRSCYYEKISRNVDFGRLIRRMVECKFIKITGDHNEIHVVDLSRREALE